MSVLWRGDRVTRLRIGSGLVLFAYVFFHFVNIALGLVSGPAMDAMQAGRQVITRSLPGTLLLYGALLTHGGLALWSVVRARSLRLPGWHLLQMALGLTIPVLLTVHVVHTRMAHDLFGVTDRMGFLIGLIWGTPSALQQSVLLLLVWTHGCLGLHFWLRLHRGWARLLPLWTALAAVVPVLALAGFLTEGRRISALLADPALAGGLQAGWNWPTPEAFGALLRISLDLTDLYWLLLAAAVAAHLLRRLLARRRHSLRIAYVDGPRVATAPGPTLLEISQSHGVPHMSLCGGRGRCTTCRVVIEHGADALPPPEEAERRALAAVRAPEGTRLACQLRPMGDATVFRVFRPDTGRPSAHPGQSRERRLAVLFLDMRGFTERTARQLPYDVVFLLNRYFSAIVPPIVAAGGTVDKYLGDGLLAVFDATDKSASARAGLRAAAGIGAALQRFNADLAAEGTPEIRIGLGLHLGTLVLGEIGASGHAQRTIIGDTVNVASRLEAKTKDLGACALISDSLLQAAALDGTTAPLQPLTLRGVAQPVQALAIHNWNDIPIPSQHA